ncbi:MAG: hypothetical protein GX643_12535 [Acidimicrobiales bacterium]|nr:hypothetical protein [Acidimicrobiales bacterium]
MAAGMLVEISTPDAVRNDPMGEFHAYSPPIAHASAPSWRGSMSPAAARPVSRVAGMDHRISPVAASRMVAPRLPDWAIDSWAANTSRPSRLGMRSETCRASPWPSPVL